jgi:hypothetical protein
MAHILPVDTVHGLNGADKCRVDAVTAESLQQRGNERDEGWHA